jgi:hypothetical protein
LTTHWIAISVDVSLIVILSILAIFAVLSRVVPDPAANTVKHS